MRQVIATLVTLCFLGSALALPQRYYIVPLISKTLQSDDSGQFLLRYQTGDGADIQETGYLKPTNDGQDRVLAKQGGFSYTSPEGVPVQVTYVADEYGFKPQGNVLPVPVQPLPPTF